MRTLCTFGLLLVLAVAQPALANLIVLSPTDDAQLDRTAYQQPYVLTNPPSYGIYMYRSSTGELHEGFLEYSLASLPSNANVTSASFTYRVNLITSSGNTYPSLSLHLYDGGSGGQVTYADLSKNLINVAQSQDITGAGTYTTDFFSVWALNNRATNFPSGFLGLDLFARVEGYQTGIWSIEDAQQFGFQAPVLTITYTVPEPAGLSLVGTASALLLMYWRARGKK